MKRFEFRIIDEVWFFKWFLRFETLNDYILGFNDKFYVFIDNETGMDLIACKNKPADIPEGFEFIEIK